MGQLSQLIVMVEAEGVDAVLNALGKVDTAQTKLADDSKKSAGKQKSAANEIKTAWTQMSTGVNQAMEVVRKAVQAGTAVYNFSKEGAQLEFVAGKFDRLATAAGTSSDALLVDLKRVSRGIMSDAELMETATTMMTLGLAETHDEAVRLTNVASQLGMSMNQLVLTLTNKTTMRFDTLGVKVAGFDDKLKALEATGMDVQKAFTTAFLQQAEEQIETVGSVADTTAGSFMRLEAAYDNWINRVKLGAGAEAKPIAEELALGFDAMVLEQQINDAKKMLEGFGNDFSAQKKVLGLDNFYFFRSDEYIADAEKALERVALYKKQHDYLVKELGYTNEQAAWQLDQTWGTFTYESMYTSPDYDDRDGNGRPSPYNRTTPKPADDLAFNPQEYITTATGAGAQFAFLTQSSGTYSDLLSEIKAKQDELAGMKPWQKASESGRQLQSDIDALIAKLDDLGTAMKVDALKSAIEANGDVTEQEYAMMLDYMVQAGMVTEQTAKSMMEDWRDLNNFQQSLRWDAEGNIVMIADDAYATIDELKQQLRSIERTIGITVRVSQMGQLPNNIVRYTNALGGAVYPGRQYLWQEDGRDGELLIPEKYGRVLNQVEVAQALREAFKPESESGKSGGSYKQPETQKNVSVTVNATIANDLDLDRLTREIVRRINL